MASRFNGGKAAADEWLKNYEASKNATDREEEERKRQELLERERQRELDYQAFRNAKMQAEGVVNAPKTAEIQSAEPVRNSMAEEIDYANQKVGELSKDEQGWLKKLANYTRQLDTMKLAAAMGGGDVYTMQKYGLSDEKKEADEARENLKKTGKDYTKYLQYETEIQDAQERKENQDRITADLNTGNKAKDFANAAMYTGLDIAMSPITGLMAIGENINARNYADKNAPVNTNSTLYQLSNLGTDIEQKTNERIGEDNKLGQFAYGTGVSMGKAALAMAEGGMASGMAGATGKAANLIADAVTLPTFGGSAYATTLQDAQERGLSHAQAQATATVAGAAEMVFEKISLDKFWDIAKNQGKAFTRNAVANILAQSGIEGSEEAFTDIANIIADHFINGDKSEYAQNVKEYGKDEAFKMLLSQIGMDALGGAISGAVFGSVGTGANVLSQTKNANDVFGEKGSIRETADALDTESYDNEADKKLARDTKVYAEELADKEDRGEKVTNKEKRELWNRVNDVMYAAQKADPEVVKAQATDNVNTILAEENQKLDMPDVAQAEGLTQEEKVVNADLDQIEEEIFNNIETPEEFKAQPNNLTFEQAYDQIASATTPEQLASAISDAENSQNITPQEMKEIDFTANIVKNNLNLTDEDLDVQTPEKAFRAGTRDDSEFMPNTEAEQRAYVQGKIARVQAVNREKDPKTATAKDNSGNTFTVKNIENVNGETMVTTNNGQTMPLSDLTFNSAQSQKVFNNAAKSVNPQAYIDDYNPGYNVDFYNDDINAIYNYGRLHGENGSFADALKDTHYGSRLKNAQTFYDAGVSEYEGEKETKKTVQNTRKAEGKVEDKSGKLSKNSKKVLEALSKKTGVDIAAVSDEGLQTKDGKTINGFFDAKDNKITLNADGKDVYKTLIHEAMGELSEEYAPKEMDELQLAIIDWHLSKHPKAFNETVAKYQQAYQNHEGSKSYREAANEYVNDCLVELFSDEQGVKDFAEFISDKPKSIFDKFIELIDSIINGIKDLMGISEHNMFADDLKAMQDLRKMALDTWNKAIENKAGATESKQAASVDVESNNGMAKNVKNHDYTYDTLTHKDPIPLYNPKDLGLKEEKFTKSTTRSGYVKTTRDNIKEYNNNNGLDEKHLYNKDIGSNVAIGSEGLKHGGKKLKENTVIASVNLPAFFENAVVVNEADGEKGADKMYVMFGAYDDGTGVRLCRVLVNHYGGEYVVGDDSLYALKLKNRRNGLALKPTGKPGSSTSSKLTISQLLDLVKEYFPNDVSEDVANHYGYTRGESDIRGLRYSLDIGDVEKKAIEHFGTTDDFNVAGYMLKDGTLLDFSGAHWLEGRDPKYIEDWKKKNDIRQVDHEDIYEVMEANGDNRKQFIERGNIRLQAEAPGFNLSAKVEPTATQYRELKEFIRYIKNDPRHDGSRFFVDLEGDKPNKISYANNINEDRIVNDLKKYYETGELPNNNLNDFRYSIDVEYQEAYENNDVEKMEELVRQAAINAGYDSPMLYHGTSSFGKTKLSDFGGIFTTTEPHIARTYSNSSNPITEIGDVNKHKANNIDVVPEDKLLDFINAHKEDIDLRYDVIGLDNKSKYIIRDSFGKNGKIEEWQLRSDIRNSLNRNGVKEKYSGVYKFYGKTDNALVIDAKGRAWNDFTAAKVRNALKLSAKEIPNGTKYTTDDISKLAKEKGYRLLIVNNVSDSSYGLKDSENPIGTDYIFFYPSTDVKSADTVTYDDDGNVVPLSERFNDTDNDLRFSLDVDSDGKKLTEGQKEYFANTKVLDEDGDLQKVFHGTLRTFYEFKKDYANAEGDMGKGFYFTNDENDVDMNYANVDGADFTNKVEREAEMLQQMDENYEDKDLDEIVDELKKKYVEEPITLECYLNITNPCYVGEYNGHTPTYLLTDIESPSEEDFEDDDDYYYAQEEAYGEYVEDILADLDLDQSGLAEVSQVLREAIELGGITLTDLKEQLNAKYLEDPETGELVANEVARQIVESLGYDGIIDSTVSEKFKNMGLSSYSTHYIVFNSNQAKLTTNENPTDNLDIRLSLDVDTENNKLSEDQQRFFANSKARDDDGRLLVLYHGTDNEFTTFIPRYAMGWGTGIYLTDNKSQAGEFGKNVMRMYVNITKPYDARTMKLEDLVDEMADSPTIKEYMRNYNANLRDTYGIEDDEVVFNDSVLEDIYDEEIDVFTNALADLGYDGIIADHSNDIEGLEIVVFNPNQVKSVDNLHPTENDDIRYSIDVVDDIEKRTKRYELDQDLLDAMDEKSYEQITDDTMSQILNSVNNVFKGQTVNKAQIQNVAKEIKDYAHSTINTENLVNELENLFNYMQNSEIDSREAFNMFKTVARDVLEHGETEDYDYNGFRKYVRGMKIRLNDNQKAYVAKAFDSYNNFRKDNFGTLVLSDEGQYLDSIWKELVNMSGNVLKLDENESSQPIALVDYINSLKGQPVNNYGGNMDEASTDMAIRILEKYYASEQQAIVDKATKEALTKPDAEVKRLLDNARKQMRSTEQEFKKAVKGEFNERETNLLAELHNLRGDLTNLDKKYARMMAQSKSPLTKYMESQAKADEKRKINQISNRLLKMVYSPTANLHMPEALRNPIGEFLAGIDFISHRGQPDSLQKGRWQTKMDNLRAFLESEDDAIQNVTELIEDELLEDMKNFTLNHAEVNKISQMGSEDLHDLYMILTRLSSTVSKANETFANDVYKSIDELNKESIVELRSMSEPKFTHPVMMSIRDFFGKNLEDPVTYFELLGKAPKSLYDGLLKGFDRRTMHIKDTQEFMNTLMPDGAYKWENDKHIFNTKEGQLELTTAQIMSLYELSKRKNADTHLFSGGIKSEITEHGYTRTSPKAYHLSEADYETIFGTLTDEQKEIADKMQEYMAVECAKWGNNVSMTLWGYEKFKEKDYFPMKVDSTSRNTSNNDTNVPNLYANKNMSSSKELVEKADNPLIISDIFDVFTEHVADMATYDGMVLPQMDAMRWFNFRSKSIKGTGENYVDGTKQQIERIYGKAGTQYFTNLMLGINGTEPRARGIQLQNAMIGRYKKVAVTAKIRVAIQQPTSFVRAYDEMDGKYLTQALLSTNPVKYANKAKEKSMLAWWKGQGYYEAYLGKGLKDIIVGKNPVYQKIEDFEGWGAQTADDLTWGVLYHAAELEIKDTTDLKEGTKAFDDAVVKRFEDVVTKTQVVDTTLHRTDIMRSQNDLVKIATSFMTEPLKTYNMVLRSVVGAERDRDKKAIQKLIKTLFVYLINNAILSAVTTTWDAFRKDDDKTPYIERWKEMYGEEFIDNLNPVNMIPIVKDIVDIVASKLNGEYYNNSDMTYDAISKTATFLSHLVKTVNGDKVSVTPYGLVKEGVQAVSYLAGVPVVNVWNDIEGIYNGLFENIETKVSSPYNKLYNAIDRGDDLTEAIKYLQDEGKDKSVIRGQITRHYKPTYLEMTDMTEKANMKNTLIKAYMADGYSREEAIKIIDGWE